MHQPGSLWAELKNRVSKEAYKPVSVLPAGMGQKSCGRTLWKAKHFTQVNQFKENKSPENV